nr:bidirectional sugar transporter NEC1-like [Tanacetum cinerariifolium]
MFRRGGSVCSCASVSGSGLCGGGFSGDWWWWWWAFLEIQQLLPRMSSKHSRSKARRPGGGGMVEEDKQTEISTVKLVALFNVIAFGVIIATTTYAIEHGPKHVVVVGWICAIISVCVFAAPLSIMRLVIKRKSVEYMPFSLSFFLTLCAVMWFFYGLLIKDYYVAIPNVIGFLFGTSQMILYMIVDLGASVGGQVKPPVELEISTVKLVALFNVIAFRVIIATTTYAIEHGPKRVAVVGWICVIILVCVFAAPLSIMRLVIKRKSVEYMPFSLSFFLTLCAVMWFFCGLLIKDYYVAIPNVIGFLFGTSQMILYMIVDLGASVGGQVKPRVELEVIVEMQEDLVSGDEVVNEKKEDVAKVSVELDREKTIIPSVV